MIAVKKSKPAPAVREYTRSFYEKNRLCFAVGICFSLLEIPVNLGLSWLLGRVLDLVAAGDLAGLFHLVWYMIAVAAGETLICTVKSRTTSLFVHRGLRQYKTLAFRKLSQKSIRAFTKENTGRYVSVLTNDVNSLEENYLLSFFDIVFYSIQFVCTLLFMLWYSPVMTAATLVLCLLPMVGTMLFAPELSRREKAVSDGSERFVARLKDLLMGFSVLKSFKAETQAAALFDGANADLETLKRRRRWWRGLMGAVNWGVFASTMQFGIFFIGAVLAIRGSVTLGTTIVFVQVCNYLMSAVQQVPQQLAARRAARGLIEKLAEITQENAAASGDPIPPELHEGIVLRDVSFGYDPDAPVLRHLSCTLQAGKKYALVGASGSGKSTLLSLLMGAYDGYTGSIALDGKELKTVDPDSLYDLISLIDQNVFLFDDTVRGNITLFKDFPAAAVDRAVERSGLSAFLQDRGEDARCGENGVELSGGERQRISIARALLKGTPVLLLDEATAALDNRTAFAVTESILRLEGLTRLVVTHRLDPALLEQYDEILVLKDGALREHGTFEELMARGGYFHALYTVAE